MRVTIETSNPAVITKVMSVCVENSTKASPVWVMGEPDASPSSLPPAKKPNGTRRGRQHRICLQCKKGFLGHQNKKYCSKRCTGKHYYDNVIKPGIKQANKAKSKAPEA